jgi:GNAT superfamily N-acetyltransferase
VQAFLLSGIKTKVRPGKPSDAPFIVGANARLALETEGRRLSPTRLKTGVRTLLRDKSKGAYFIAEVADEIAGQLLITREWSDWRNGHFWWIQGVYVVEKFRGQGVFRALFNHVRALAKAKADVCGLRLYMEAGNTRARRAYERLGFTHWDSDVQYRAAEAGSGSG